jgi:hypothetical protein
MSFKTLSISLKVRRLRAYLECGDRIERLKWNVLIQRNRIQGKRNNYTICSDKRNFKLPITIYKEHLNFREIL